MALYPLQKRFHRQASQRAVRHGQSRAEPEAHIYWSFLGALLLPIALYGFAWLSFGPPRIPWFAPVIFIAIFSTGFHINYVFISDYTVEAYGMLASSAITAESTLRELIAIAGTLFAEPSKL